MIIGVIGGNGFIGQFIAEYCQSRGDTVIIIVRGSVGDHYHIFFDVLIDCNGNSYRYKANEDPGGDFDRNVSVLKDYCLQLQYRHFILMSSIDVYDNISNPEMNMESCELPIENLNPYGFHKLLREMIVRNYCPSYHVLRLGTVVGSRMKKGPLYDLQNVGELFMHEDSSLSLISENVICRVVDHILNEKLKKNIYNVCGTPFFLREFISEYFQNLTLDNESKTCYRYHINNARISNEMVIPSSLEMARECLEALGKRSLL